MSYQEFLSQKHLRFQGSGLDVVPFDHGQFDWQMQIINWALAKGRAAILADCGLGKTLMQLSWAEMVACDTNTPVLVLTPVAVARQTEAESRKFGIIPDTYIVECADDVATSEPGICITNYEKLHLFDPSVFAGVVLDESSILKSFTGRRKRQLLEAFCETPYRLACTATPSPNDLLELGNHSEFLGVLPSQEMISRFFLNDSMKAGGYKLKRHAESDFWDWMASWSVCVSCPSDLGFSDEGYRMPDLHINSHIIQTSQAPEGFLFDTQKPNATNLNRIRRASLQERAGKVAEIVNQSADQWCVWCAINDEADALRALIPDAVEVRGSHSPQIKAERFESFQDGSARVLITKPKIGGWGMNWQHCHRMTWFPSFSFEEFYQCVRRFYRFGQQHEVSVEVVMTDAESSVQQAMIRKQVQHATMHSEMASRMAELTRRELAGDPLKPVKYQANRAGQLPDWLQSKTE